LSSNNRQSYKKSIDEKDDIMEETELVK